MRLWPPNPYNITANQIGLGGGTANVGTGIGQILSKLLILAGILALVFMVVGAIQITASNGDSKRVQQGRDTLLYASIGLILTIAAFALG